MHNLKLLKLKDFVCRDVIALRECYQNCLSNAPI